MLCCELSAAPSSLKVDIRSSSVLWEKLESKLVAQGLSFADLERLELSELEGLLIELDLCSAERQQTIQALRVRAAASESTPQSVKPKHLSLGVSTPAKVADMGRCNPGTSKALASTGQTYWQTMPAKLVHFEDDIRSQNDVVTGASSARDHREAVEGASASSTKVPSRKGNPNHKTLTQTHRDLQFRPWRPPSLVLPDD